MEILQTTGASMSFLRRILPSLLLFLAHPLAADERWAPNAAAGPVNQLEVSGNACGPAALLASLRNGSEDWQAVATKLPGESNRSKLLYIIRAHGLQPSESLSKRKRWSKDGINVEDLAAITGELAAIGGVFKPTTESLIRKGRESPERQLDRLHDRLRDSLKRGFPPVLSLRRYVLRGGEWRTLEGHFVTVVMVPEKLPRGASEFPFTYFDPWGGRKCRGVFGLPQSGVLADPDGSSPFLEARVPEARISRDKVRSGEKTTVVPTVMIRR